MVRKLLVTVRGRKTMRYYVYQNKKRVRLPPLATSVSVTDVRLADDSDSWSLVAGVVRSASGSSGGHSQESGDNKLL